MATNEIIIKGKTMEKDLNNELIDSNSSEEKQSETESFPGKSISRRQFLIGSAAMTLMMSMKEKLANAQTGNMLPDPDKSGIEHIILVMMENRSFDHFLGWLPGADGKQAGLTFVDRNGKPQTTFGLAPEFQACDNSDPDHSFEGGRVQFNDGACDGWLRSGDNDAFSVGYYTQKDLLFFGTAAPTFTVLDRYFPAIMGPTFPNRLYQHSAQTDRLSNLQDPQNNISKLPTIWDRLAEKGLKGRYYFTDLPVLGLYGAKYLSISQSVNQFYADCASGNLASVSYVDPGFLGAFNGTSNDDHPHSDIRDGETFLSKVYKSVTKSPAWPKTVLIINFDEWGGFYDHVPPPTRPIPEADRIAGNIDGRLGFRVPCLVISPFARRGFVSSTVFDHTSILKLIEWRWTLSPLTIRDETANNIAEVLDFSAPNLKVPKIKVPKKTFGKKCPPGVSKQDWDILFEMSRIHGWPV
jgi:phospholipase C